MCGIGARSQRALDLLTWLHEHVGVCMQFRGGAAGGVLDRSHSERECKFGFIDARMTRMNSSTRSPPPLCYIRLRARQIAARQISGSHRGKYESR